MALRRADTNMLNISQAALAAGIHPKMVRYYESIGVMPPAQRTASGYRQYSQTDVHTLQFVRRARDLGFSLEDIQQLVSLWHNQSRTSAEVKQLALEHMQQLENKISELQTMYQTLRHLAAACHGDERPDCPILSDLASAPLAGSQGRKKAEAKKA